MALSDISRLRADEIQNGLNADAGDVNAELDQLVSTANDIIDQSNTNETDIASNAADISTLQSDLNTAEGDIVTLQSSLATAEGDIDTLEDQSLGGSLSIASNTTLDGSFDTTRQIILNSKGITLTLPDPSGTFTAGERWLVTCRATGACFLDTDYAGPDTNTDIALNDGDMAMISVIDDTVAGLQYAIGIMRAGIAANEWEERTTSKTYVAADLPKDIWWHGTTGVTLTLPELDDQLIGREVRVHNVDDTQGVTVAAHAGDGINDAASVVVAAGESGLFVAGPQHSATAGKRNWGVILNQ